MSLVPCWARDNNSGVYVALNRNRAPFPMTDTEGAIRVVHSLCSDPAGASDTLSEYICETDIDGRICSPVAAAPDADAGGGLGENGVEYCAHTDECNRNTSAKEGNPTALAASCNLLPLTIFRCCCCTGLLFATIGIAIAIAIAIAPI